MLTIELSTSRIFYEMVPGMTIPPVETEDQRGDFVSEPQFSHLENRNSEIYHLGLLWGLKR